VRTPRIVAVAALVVLAVSGCSATTAPPQALSDAELDDRVRAELDRQWAFTGLDGVVPRPEPAVEIVGTDGAASQGFWECMSAAGFESWGFSGDAGLTLSLADGSAPAPSPDQQLAFYSCNARFPMIDTLTVDQLNFIYDYYQRWLIPCLADAGYPVGVAPSRREFTTETPQFGWRWRPYAAIADVPGETRYVALQRECKPTLPGIDGWSQQFSLF
jgi:hypothetical protein